jgi:SAM-dependent methyltransferase
MSMKHYALPAARLRAFYQLPTPPGLTAALELHIDDSGKVLDDEWPAETLISCRLTAEQPSNNNRVGGRIQEREVSILEVLPFQRDTFDIVILHYTLDELAKLLPARNSHQVVDDWLTRVARLLRPGGLVVGCTANATSPRHWFKPTAALGIESCRKALLRAGYRDPEIFNLIPNVEAPRAIYSTEPLASGRAFSRELDATRGHFSCSSYLIRKAIVAYRLNRYLEGTLFFWGHKPC